MARKRDRKSIFLGPVVVTLLITLFIMIISAIFSIIGIEGEKALIVNGTIEMSLITVKNIFSIDGLKYIFGSAVTNFRLLEPLVLLIISFISVSILETSGIMEDNANKLKKLKSSFLTFLLIFISIGFGFFGIYSYIILLPLVGALYYYMGKNPFSGIITSFLAISLGYGTGLIVNYDMFVMGNITELVAITQVDKNYQFSIFSTIYIMIASTFIISFIMTLMNKNIDSKLPKPCVDKEDKIISSKAKIISNIVLLILGLLLVYMIIPGLPYSGLLLNNDEPNYIAKLFSDGSTFKDGFIYIILIFSMIYGYIYGKISGNVKNLNDYNVGLSKYFDGVGYSFMLMFFASYMVGILNWTNLSYVIVTKMISFISLLPFSGLPLIFVFFFLVIVMSMFIPETVVKWQLIAPLIVPLFMRANLTPEFTQFIYGVADGIGKSFTPIFIYFIIMVGLLQKYNKIDYKVSIGGTLKVIMPTVITIGAFWLLLIIIWYIVGLPLGIGSVITL